jgi:hypothetical protein
MDRFDRPSVLLMHEAFRGQAPGKIGMMGIPVLSGIVRRIRPQICLTGHHHSYAITDRGPEGQTLAISLPRAPEGYMRLWFTPQGERAAWEYVSIGDPMPDDD